jgi:SpoVK/Ycf46/Vps4 family AAA+-type ATPase
MVLTPRDRRLTKAISLLLSSDKVIVATARILSSVDPCLLVPFAKTFCLHPPDIEGRLALLKSLPSKIDGGLIRQFRALGDEQSQRDLLKQYAGLQPSELILAEEYRPLSSLDAVAGIGGLLARLQFLILSPITDPQLFVETGAKPPRGVMLTGKPGCGKSLAARSIAGASRVSFFDIAAVEIIAKEVGQSEKQLHAIFERARAAAPSIILFDDIDAIAPRRTFETSAAGDRLLTTLLVEMDGLAGRDDGVVIIATTNRPQALDPALTRPGRFDYIIEMPIPDAAARGEIFDLHTRMTPLVDRPRCREAVVRATEGRSGAVIAGIVREAAMIALRKDIGSDAVTLEAFLEAIESAAAPTPTREPARKRIYKF